MSPDVIYTASGIHDREAGFLYRIGFRHPNITEHNGKLDMNGYVTMMFTSKKQYYHGLSDLNRFRMKVGMPYALSKEVSFYQILNRKSL